MTEHALPPIETLIDGIESLAEPFVVWSADDRLVICNSKYRNQFAEPERVVPGVAFAELVEMNMVFGSVLRLQDIEEANSKPEAYRERRLRYHNDCRDTVQQLKANGQWLQFRERRTGSGGIVGIYTDITDRKRAEAALVEARREADRANRAKSQILAAASHDLRQPLHAIGILASTLKSRVHDPEIRRLAQNIDACVQSMTGLFDSLLDMSKLDAGVVETRPRRFPLCDIASMIAREFGPPALEKGLRLRVLPSAREVRSDPEILGRIMRNLVSNAIRYTDRGGVLVGARRRGDHMSLEVVDTGIGIPPDQVELAFEEFRQLGPGQTDQPGLGLGLAISSRLARILGHEIGVTSEPGRGSRFWVRLPLCAEAAAGATDPPEPELEDGPADLPARRILIADDNKDVRRATSELLRAWGQHVTATASPEELGRLAEDLDQPPDLILLDFHFTRPAGGVASAKDLRRTWGDRVAIVVLTGETTAASLTEIKKLGFPVMHKPLRPVRLRALVQGLRAVSN